MTIVLNATTGITTPPVSVEGSTSGTITLVAPAVAGTNTQTLVAATGTLAPLIASTAVASTSGTSIEFTNIPSWVKRVTVMLNGVSTNGTAAIQIQLGTGVTPTYAISGYTSGAQVSVQTAITTGFNLENSGSGAIGNTLIGAYTLTLFNSNTWIGNGVMYLNGSNNSFSSGISPALGGALSAIRVIGSATGNPADTFDLGSINILYE